MFKNSIKVGSLFGIEIGISLFWILLFVFFTSQASSFFNSELGLPKMVSAFSGVFLIGGLYASILAHEFGHALTAKGFGINTRRIILHLFGGVALMEAEPRSPKEEFWITIMGPAVSLFLAIIFGIVWVAASQLTVPEPFPTIFIYLAIMNLIMAIFNLLPGFPMDGGRILRSTIWYYTDNYLQSTRIATIGGTIVGSGFIALGLVRFLLGGFDLFSLIMPVLLGIFVIRLSKMSMRDAEIINSFRGKTVRQLMQPIQAVVHADWTVRDIYEHIQFFNQQEIYPVVEGDRLIGQLFYQDIATIEQRQWDWIKATEVAKPIDPSRIISPEIDVMAAIQKLSTMKMNSMAVFQGRKLLGYIRLADLIHYSRNTRQGYARPRQAY